MLVYQIQNSLKWKSNCMHSKSSRWSQRL